MAEAAAPVRHMVRTIKRFDDGKGMAEQVGKNNGAGALGEYAGTCRIKFYRGRGQNPTFGPESLLFRVPECGVAA